jgi:serine-type D-Ala-D-Ala carboxypeptidase/endopeptidase
MKILACSLYTTFLFLVSFQSHAQVNEDSLFAVAKKLGMEMVTDKQAVGLSIGVYTNEKTYYYNFGTTEKGKVSLPTEQTIYEIGSITKTFVSYVLANAVLENKVSLQDDIRKYLKGKYSNLEYKGHPIRLVHLANTTSGLPERIPALPAIAKQLSGDSLLQLKIDTYGSLTKKDFLQALHKVTIDTIPGTKLAHSNGAAQLLAYILEDVYQESMDQLINRMILAPFGLTNTFFITAQTANLATGYTSAGKTGMYEFVIPYSKNTGGLGSTTEDLIKYSKIFLNTYDKAAALSLKKTVDADVSSGKAVAIRPDNVAAPEVYSMALNWFKYKPDTTSSQVWADGGTNGFNSYLVIYPHLKSTVVVMANKSDEKIFRALPGIAYKLAEVIRKKYK